MAKSLRDNLGRRMRAADGSRRLVFGGPEAEKQFAEAQLLQQQMTSGNAMQNLTAAQNNAAQIAQQNIAANMQDEQFRQQLAQEQRQAEDRLALDRQRQQAQQAEALGNLRLRAGTLDIDQQRLRNQATQYANQLRLQERTLDQRQAENELSQKTRISTIAEGLLKEAASLDLTEEGRVELSKLQSAYRAIQRNRDNMRPSQYNELMQDWMGKMEQANLGQYTNQQLPFAERAAAGFELIQRDGLTFLATPGRDGQVDYQLLSQDEAAAAGVQQRDLPYYVNRFRTDAKFAADVYDDALALANSMLPPDAMPLQRLPEGQEFAFIEQVLRSKVDLNRNLDSLLMPQAPAGQQPAQGGAVQPPQTSGSMNDLRSMMQQQYGNEDNIVSASDFPPPSAAAAEPTYGGSKLPYGLSWKRLWSGDDKQTGFFGTDRDFKRITAAPEISLKKSIDTHQKQMSDEETTIAQNVIREQIPMIVQSPQAKSLADAYQRSTGKQLDFGKVFNPTIIANMLKLGIENPLQNLMDGVAEAMDEGIDHVGTVNSASVHSMVNAPVIMRAAFENLDEKAFREKMPPIWYDEFGLMHAQEPQDKEPQGSFRDRKSYRSDVPYMVPMGY